MIVFFAGGVGGVYVSPCIISGMSRHLSRTTDIPHMKESKSWDSNLQWLGASDSKSTTLTTWPYTPLNLMIERQLKLLLNK